MRRERLRELLLSLRSGDVAVDDVVDRLSGAPTEDLGFATVDHHRTVRLGHPEAVFCEGKTVDEVVEICRRLAGRGDGFLATRAAPEQLDALASAFPSAELCRRGRSAHLRADDGGRPRSRGTVLVVSGGTADLPVAEEARFAAAAMGNPVETRYDVGVAGLHRILDVRGELAEAAVVVVVAGMDGALASVVGGLVPTPVVAVPTSVGYGASFDGVAPLLTMLNACSPGIAVVNIDNGYGAACAATRINQDRAGRGGGR